MNTMNGTTNEGNTVTDLTVLSRQYHAFHYAKELAEAKALTADDERLMLDARRYAGWSDSKAIQGEMQVIDRAFEEASQKAAA